MAHPLQFTPSHQRRKRGKKKTQKHIRVGGFRSALDHGWVASDQCGWLQLGMGRVWSWGVGGHRCSWLAVGRVRSPWVAGRGSDRPLLHMRCHSIRLIFLPLLSPTMVGLIGFLGFIFLVFQVSFFCVFWVLIF